MGDTQLPFDQRLPFVDPSQEYVAEVERPNAVIDLFEADAMLLERGREIEQPGLEANGAGVGDPLHEEVPGIFERGQCAGIRARRRAVERAGRPPAQKLVGPFVVVLLAKPVEGALLGRERRAGRPNRALLQRFVHALVGAVLLWVRRQDALVLNAEAEPPHVERREAVQRRRSEGDAVVGPHRAR